VSSAEPDFPYPLNVLRRVLALEGVPSDALHYGLFEREGESLEAAQERSTALLLERLPPPPARILEVGIGLGATLDRLRRLGYRAVGITPDGAQARLASARFEGLPIRVASLEGYDTTERFDVVLFQESSQYIESGTLWARTRALAAPGGRVLVIDEFALAPVDRPGALHRLDRFLEAGKQEGFRLEEELDRSRQAAPTVDWFLRRIPIHRASIERDLGVAGEKLDELLASGAAYRNSYASGEYGYRLLSFRGPDVRFAAD